MTQNYQIYRCNICGNIVEVLHSGVGQLVCCDQPMELLKEKNEEQGYEKHLPVIEKKEKNVKVKVGSIPHPMEENHYIEWIEIMVDGKICRQFLNPGEEPEAIFEIIGNKIEAREYCNVHGLWKK